MRPALYPVTPFDVVRRPSTILDIACRLETPTGWLDLEDDEHYELHGDALAQRAVTWRKQQVSSPYVEGTYTTAAVKENVTEALVVLVRGGDPLELADLIAAVTDGFDQMAFQVMLTINGMVEYWTCVEPAGYTIEMQREFRHAVIGVIRGEVVRLPPLTYAAAAQEEM